LPRRQKKPKLTQVNALFFEEDIEAIKAMARAELSLTWHPKLRQILRLGVLAAKSKKVIK
jgi:hypothetical protein